MSDQAINNVAASIKLDAAIDAQIKQAIGLMIRGILVSCGQNIPADAVLRSVARCTGNCLSQALIGDIASVLKLRVSIKEQFIKAVDDVVPQPLPPLHPQPPGRQ